VHDIRWQMLWLRRLLSVASAPPPCTAGAWERDRERQRVALLLLSVTAASARRPRPSKGPPAALADFSRRKSPSSRQSPTEPRAWARLACQGFGLARPAWPGEGEGEGER
jgi:hypothetical protein